MTDTTQPTDLDLDVDGQTTRSRRNLLRLAGATAAGVAVAAVAGGRSAQAANGDNMVIGNAIQTGTQPTGLIGSSFQTFLSSPGSFALAGANTSSNGSSIGVQGVSSGGVGVQGLNTTGPLASIANGTGVQGQGDVYGVHGTSQDGVGVSGHAHNGVGVEGVSDNSAGVDAMSGTYIDLRCLGTGRMWLTQHTAGGAPTSGSYFAGEVIRDSNGAFYVCVNGNGGGPGVWRKIGGQNTAGSLHPMSAPARVYDSRKTMTPMANGILATGASRTISVADRRDVTTGAIVQLGVVPAGATAVTYNLTAVSTVGTNGYLSVNPGTDTTVYSSHLNWTAAGLSIANAGTVGLDASRQITVICGGTATSAHFIVDITGYYL